MNRWIFLGVICVHSVAFGAQEVDLGCKHLRIILDPRLSPDVVEHEWGRGITHSALPATLELVGCQGQLLDRFALEAPLAQLDPAPLRGAPNPTYLVSADLTVDAGSYNGPLTIPIQVVQDHLVAVVARIADKGVESIRLTLTGKSAWRRVADGDVDNLLLVSCRPEGRSFVTLYRRYFPSRRKWKVKMRSRTGLWESDGEFPNRKLFP